MHGTPSAWRVPGYTEIRELGAGAAGRVVMARHDADGVMVAIKYLSDELRNDVGFVARFRHEARVLNTLSSPHSVLLYDYVETGDGAAIVMELVNGVALRALLRSEGPTGPEAALVVLKGSLLGLAAAHSARVVHRDFKPENVMVEADGTSKLVDFGIAVRSGDGDLPAGTPPYMAPEQWMGGPAGPATDVYAATVVFFECLTGTRPFRATNIAALARQHQASPPPVEEVPAALRGLVERGLAKHPADRPPTAAAFLTELEAVAAESYGPDWEERGLRRLAAIAGLLAALFPAEAPPPPGVDTSLAMTELEGDDDDADHHEGSSPIGRLGVKILAGVGCVAVIGGLTAVLVGGGGTTEVGSQSPVTTRPSPAAETVVPVEESDEPVEETEEPAEDTPAPTPSPSTTSTSGPPPVAPPTGPAATPDASERPTARPTTRPTTRPTRRATTRPSEPASEAPTPEEDSTLGDPGPGAPSTRPPSTRPTTPTTPTTPRTTSSPSERPTTTPTETPTSTTSSEPSPTTTRTNDGSTPRSSDTSPGRAGLTTSPSPLGAAPAAFLALGLVTSGAVPFTLVVRRDMAGRHRRRR
ncbi:serine/threonine-protein kinase [Streptosporangium sp. NPDC023615]|uniref:serine/threonine-protein kinase n=1 Tax=Streptosporangium sp. NPDC023615 TaxID=3154794 RepID=UPI00342EDC84